MNRLTICSVSYNSQPYLDQNWKLTSYLNRKWKLNWIIVDNTWHGSKQLPYNAKFTYIKGVVSKWEGIAKGSYHHGAALNKALGYVKTRFLLVLDPDFFIIKKNWINKVLNNMQDNNLSFFGAPYFPNRYVKYQYFPSGTCMFIDLGKIKKKDLDFMPEIYETNELVGQKFSELVKIFFYTMIIKNRSQKSQYTSGLIQDVIKRKLLLKIVPLRYHTILSVNSSFDLGYKIYRKFHNNRKYRSEFLISAWKNPFFTSDFRISGITDKLLGKWFVRWILPDSFIIYPKKKSYTTDLRFGHYNLPDVNKQGWEEYFWQDQPFGFHIRGLFHGMQKVKFSNLSKIINDFKHTEI